MGRSLLFWPLSNEAFSPTNMSIHSTHLGRGSGGLSPAQYGWRQPKYGSDMDNLHTAPYCRVSHRGVFMSKNIAAVVSKMVTELGALKSDEERERAFAGARAVLGMTGSAVVPPPGQGGAPPAPAQQ